MESAENSTTKQIIGLDGCRMKGVEVKHIVMTLGVLLLIAGAGYQSVSAEPPPMVQRHIFAPDQVLEQKADVAPPIDAAGLEKDLVFTGVLLTSNGKRVILSESGKNAKDTQKQKHIMKEGESIKGMTIKEIGSNYLILSSNETLVRLKLYSGIKNRPAPPPEPALAAAGSAANPAGAANLPAPGNQPQKGVPAPSGSKMDMKSKNMPGGNAAPGGNAPTPIPFDNTGNGAFGGGGDNPVLQAPQTSSAPQSTSNPFLDVIKRSAENAPSDGSGVANPFTGK